MSRTRPEGLSRSSRRRRVGTAALLAVTMVVLTGCSEESVGQWKRLGLPEPATDRSVFVGPLWIGVWIAAGIIGVFTWGLILWAAFRYRRRKHDEMPVQVRYNLPMEVLYTVAPIVVVGVLFVFVAKDQEGLLKYEEPEQAITVTAQQWSWTFTYEDAEAVGGRDVWESGNAKDLPELWLVEDTPVEYQLVSPDVIHSFWVPAFYFKLDVVPGRENSFTMTPTEQGTYVGRCAEFCGYQHSRMLFTVKVVSQEEYDQHMKELAAADQFGRPVGGVESTELTGLEPTHQEASAE